jgi:Na+-translocating ferredoxin:NAD+ oxidoreductase subunit C
MRSARTFRYGGIRIGAERRVEGRVSNAFLPSTAVVLLKQHAGKSARCVVGKGDRVREGMVIGRAEGPRSADVHAPIPGLVIDVRVVPLPEGGEAEAAIIALDGAFDRLGRREERYLWKSMARRDILNAIRERGVVDTEPPGTPLYDLLSGSKEIGLLVLNAVESEPYLRAEACILAQREAEVVEGLALLRKVLNPRRTVIAAEAAARASSGSPMDSLSSAIERESSQDGGSKVEAIALEPRYPQDLPGQLLESIEGSKSRPREEVLIVRPSTVLAAFEAVVLAKPMLERYVTVDGGALRAPAVLKARIGTPIRDLISECGGFAEPPARLVLCGPFRGYAVHDLDVPTTKTTSAILALGRDEVGSSRASPCIRCGSCAESCPERLSPELLYRLVERGRIAEAEALGLGSCTLCGSCGYSCPSRVPLVSAFAARLREGEAAV